MEQAKLNVVHFNSEDVIATSGEKGIYQGSYLIGNRPTYEGNIGDTYYYRYVGSDNDKDHSNYQSAYNELALSVGNLFIDGEAFNGQALKAQTWYDKYKDYDTNTVYFYSVQ